ncbi:hypothetical protein CRUP_036268 [Coryphaenoides rupestris]|nr:hypothetical protein CRUP_036268 [Coryphaenoides rupestris]
MIRAPGRGGPPSCAETLFSAWTPLVHKPSNQQLFEERSNLLLHWFDLWSDRQRKQLLHTLLNRCSQSQLRVCRDWLTESLPAVRADFASVLPRFLSLYVMSFLNPRDLSAAARVSWHWRVLAEQRGVAWEVREPLVCPVLEPGARRPSAGRRGPRPVPLASENQEGVGQQQQPPLGHPERGVAWEVREPLVCPVLEPGARRPSAGRRGPRPVP